MKDGEAIGGDRGAGSSCPNCGRGLTNQARFCGYCGAQVPPVESMSEARLVLAMVLGWVLSTLFWLLGTDLLPGGAWTIFLFPLLILPAMVAYLAPYALVIVQAVHRFGRNGYVPLGPGLQALATFAWAFVCLLYTSEPLVEPFTAMPLLFFGLALVISWVLFVLPAAWQAWKLYTVESIYHRNDCVVLETNSGIDMAGGFAYCIDGPPTGDFVRGEHLKHNWWKYTYDSNGPR